MTTSLRNYTTATYTAAAGTKTVTLPGSSATGGNSPTQAQDGEILIDVGGTPIDTNGGPAGFGLLTSDALGTSFYVNVFRRVADTLDPGRVVTIAQQTSGRNILAVAGFAGASSIDPVYTGTTGCSPVTQVTTAATAIAGGAWTLPGGFTGKVLAVVGWKNGATNMTTVSVSSGWSLLPDQNGSTFMTVGGTGTNVLGLAVAVSNSDVSTYSPPTFTFDQAVTANVRAYALASAATTSRVRPRTDSSSSGTSTIVPALTNAGAQPGSMALSDLDPSGTYINFAPGAVRTFALDAPSTSAITIYASDFVGASSTAYDFLVELLEGTTTRASFHLNAGSTTATQHSYTLSSAEQASIGNLGNLFLRVTLNSAS